MFPTIDQAKPGLKKLIAALGETYPYASVLAVADDSREWRVSRAGVHRLWPPSWRPVGLSSPVMIKKMQPYSLYEKTHL